MALDDEDLKPLSRPVFSQARRSDWLLEVEVAAWPFAPVSDGGGGQAEEEAILWRLSRLTRFRNCQRWLIDS
jgi:hypothetical protein